MEAKEMVKYKVLLVLVLVGVVFGCVGALFENVCLR